MNDFYSFTNESALNFYSNLVGGMDPDEAYVISEGAYIERTKIMNSKDMSRIRKNMRAAYRAKNSGDVNSAKKYRDTALKDLKELRKQAKEIPDDTWVSYAGRIASGLALFAATYILFRGLEGKFAKKAIKAGVKGAAGLSAGSAGKLVGGPLGEIISAKMLGTNMKEVSRTTVLGAIDQIEAELKRI